MSAKAAGKPSFEAQLAELEAVVERLERGELTLEESVRLFEEGVRLSNACKKELSSAEGRIQMLLEPDKGEATADLDVEEDEE